MIIASQRIARWNVTTQKMKVWIHHQRVLTTALQCLATTITMPRTQALCQCGQYMWHATCLTAYRLHECPGVHSCLNHFSFFHASFLLWPFFQRTQKAQATTHFLYDSPTSNVISYSFFCYYSLQSGYYPLAILYIILLQFVFPIIISNLVTQTKGQIEMVSAMHASIKMLMMRTETLL